MARDVLDARLLEQAPCGLFLTDGQGLICAINETMLAWLEKPRSEVIGKVRFREILGVAGQIYADTHLIPMLQLNHGFQEIAMTLRSVSGKERLVLITASARGIDAPAAAAFVVFSAEHRRLYERELAAMRTAAQTRISWLRQVETMAGVGAWSLDLETRQATWSDQVFALHDLPVGRAPDLDGVLSFYPGPSRDIMATSIQRTIDTGEPFLIETEMVTALQRRRYIRAMGEVELEIGRPRRLVGVLQDITDRHDAEQRLWRNAHIDELAGIANRSWFQQTLIERLTIAKRNGSGLTLLLLDLDGFKEVNDTFGHQAGDLVIRTISQRLTACLDGGAFIARLGGDEFAILLPPARGASSVTGQAETIQTEVRKPVTYEGHPAFVTVSIGVASFPADADNPDGLYKCADMALYKVKRSGRGTMGFFNPEVEKTFDARCAAIAKVRRAAVEKSVVPFYQPKVRLLDRTVYGYEALARIVDQDGTTRSPVDFWHAFDDAESARAIDDLMLQGVVQDLARWRDLGHDPGPISLNVSEFTLQRGGYPHRLLTLLGDQHLPTSAIEIELLETVLLGRTSKDLEEVLIKLHDAGFSIALDDFGTGFASLSHLRDLPIDCVKIDKSFVLGLSAKQQNAAIVKAVVDLARYLGLRVVAEGIETEAAYEFLRAIGCNEGQGFLFGAAVRNTEVKGNLYAQDNWQELRFLH